MTKIKLTYYSDILCIWAYIAQVRLDELKTHFGTQLSIDYRFTKTFASVSTKFEAGWAHRGGSEGYATHVQALASRWPHIEVTDSAWRETLPLSSANTHIYIKAAQLAAGCTAKGGECCLAEAFILALREAFFVEGLDVSKHKVLNQIASAHGLPIEKIAEALDTGEATAAFFDDLSSAKTLFVPGSPAFVLNEGRQVLYGNVGYKALEANITELASEEAYPSEWC